MNKIKTTLLLLTALYWVNTTSVKAQQTNENVPSQYGEQFSGVPKPQDAVIYQVNMRTFSKSGDFNGVIARLDSIKALGINLIYLMPVYPVGVVKSVNSPYCVKDYQAVNKEFGSLNDLRNLVTGAHQRNMAVILDWVPNHTSFDHPWTKNKSWYLQDSTGQIISPPGTGWNDVAQLNFKNKEMRKEMISSMKYWILAANIDGFRCDYADGPPFEFWKEAIHTLRSVPRHQLLFLAEGKRRDHYTAGFDYNFGFTFFENLNAIYKHKRSVKSIDTLNITDYKDAVKNQRIVRYTTNHDVNGSDGTPQELFGGSKGSMAAFVIVSFMKSVPMIYNGQEVGTPYRLTFPFTNQKIDWSLNPQETDLYKKIIAFRNNSDAIRNGELKSYSSDDVCVFTKETAQEKVLILSNLRNTAISYTFPSSIAGTTWQDAFKGAKQALADTITLEPYSWLVLKN